MAEDGARRPKRGCVSRKNAVPSSVHYVGYVEDEETPEMIMKKFEELEKIVAASKQTCNKASDKDKSATIAGDADEVDKENQAANDQEDLEAGVEGGQRDGLTEDMLKEVFKQTSMFNVKTAMQNNDALMAGPGHASDGDVGGWSADEAGSSDEEDWEYLKSFWSDEDGVSDKQRVRKGPRGLGLPKAPGRAALKAKHSMIAHYNRDTHAFIRRKAARIVDPDALILLKPPPPPLPLSWGRAVKPYQPPATQAACSTPDVPPQEATRTFQCPDASAFDFNSLNKKYQALLINPGWTSGASADEGLAALQRIPVPKLCPVGFIFVWAEKEHLMAVVKQMYKWGYIYVENLTWVLMHPNNSILRLPYSYAGRSHITMLIFRKECEEGRAIDLKHQRSPDVFFDCMQSAEGARWKVPNEAYVAIETMLPSGMGVFLEVWGAKGVTRPGWDHIVQVAA